MVEVRVEEEMSEEEVNEYQLKQDLIYKEHKIAQMKSYAAAYGYKLEKEG